MKCPYCNEDLKEWDGRFYCANAMCPAKQEDLPKFIWRDLITGKKAQDALKVARNLYQELALAYCEMVDDYRTTYGRLKTPEQEAQEYMQEYDEKITSITKQEK